jgi:hypothetical protein
MTLTFNVPINNVSFGQTSTLILRTLFDRIKSGKVDYDVRIFPIGNNYDLSAQKQDKDFEQWIVSCIDKAFTKHDRKNPVFKLWHLNGSIESVSEKQILLSFYELDSPTPVEINCAKNNRTLFSSTYTCEVFRNTGGVETGFLPLAFDSYNFKNTGKKYFSDGRITFNVCGKFEKRKRHLEIIKSWIKKYGGNPKYALQCAIYNPFLRPEQNNQIIAQAILEGKPKPFNVSFLPSMAENEIYNDFLNSGDIVIGMSGGEGWGLPEFQSVALGKHAVILNASAYKEWANDANSVMVNPSGKIEAYDGMFFNKGQAFNQGNIFTWNEDDFIDGCEKAIARASASRINQEGLKLQQDFSKENFADNIITELRKA